MRIQTLPVSETRARTMPMVKLNSYRSPPTATVEKLKAKQIKTKTIREPAPVVERDEL